MSSMLMGLCNCAYTSSGRMAVKGNKVVYAYDPRTNLCFASVAISEPFTTEIHNFSMTAVTCNERIVALAGTPSWPYITIGSRDIESSSAGLMVSPPVSSPMYTPSAVNVPNVNSGNMIDVSNIGGF